MSVTPGPQGNAQILFYQYIIRQFSILFIYTTSPIPTLQHSNLPTLQPSNLPTFNPSNLLPNLLQQFQLKSANLRHHLNRFGNVYTRGAILFIPGLLYHSALLSRWQTKPAGGLQTRRQTVAAPPSHFGYHQRPQRGH